MGGVVAHSRCGASVFADFSHGSLPFPSFLSENCPKYCYQKTPSNLVYKNGRSGMRCVCWYFWLSGEINHKWENSWAGVLLPEFSQTMKPYELEQGNFFRSSNSKVV